MTEPDYAETPTTGPLGRFLTLADTAEILNIGVAEAHELVQSGELPAIRVGTRARWRIERDVLETYIEAMYEESRRHSLWIQSDFGGLAELSIPRSSGAPND